MLDDKLMNRQLFFDFLGMYNLSNLTLSKLRDYHLQNDGAESLKQEASRHTHLGRA